MIHRDMDFEKAESRIWKAAAWAWAWYVVKLAGGIYLFFWHVWPWLKTTIELNGWMEFPK